MTMDIRKLSHEEISAINEREVCAKLHTPKPEQICRANLHDVPEAEPVAEQLELLL
jgi:hypothetical protein